MTQAQRSSQNFLSQARGQYVSHVADTNRRVEQNRWVDNECPFVPAPSRGRIYSCGSIHMAASRGSPGKFEAFRHPEKEAKCEYEGGRTILNAVEPPMLVSKLSRRYINPKCCLKSSPDNNSGTHQHPIPASPTACLPPTTSTIGLVTSLALIAFSTMCSIREYCAECRT